MRLPSVDRSSKVCVISAYILCVCVSVYKRDWKVVDAGEEELDVRTDIAFAACFRFNCYRFIAITSISYTDRRGRKLDASIPELPRTIYIYMYMGRILRKGLNLLIFVKIKRSLIDVAS